MTGDVEVEVKLAVDDPAAIERLVVDAGPNGIAGFVADGPLEEQRIVDRYFDTADGRLLVAGARARVRTGGTDGPVLALKHHGLEAAGVTARHEVEGPATELLDPAGWPDSVAREELLAFVGDEPLVEIARLRQRRQVRLLRYGVTTVELSLDELEALDGELVTASRWELEAELKSGDRRDLEALAAALSRLPGTGPGVGSKLSFALSARPPRRT